MTRRASGDGSLHLDKARGLWVGRLSLGYDSEGKRIRRSVYAATQREAREKLRRVREAHDAGMRVSAGREPTIAQFLAAWLEDTHRPKVRASTFHRDEFAVTKYLTPVLGRYRLSALTPLHVEGLLHQMQRSGLAPRTCQQARAVLRVALNQAARWGLVQRNVAALAEPPVMVRYEVTYLDAEQAKKLLLHIEGDRLEGLVTVALAVGLRQGEALGLTWDAIDLDTGSLAVRQSLQRIDGEYQYLPPKTTKSRRTIPLPAVVIQALRRHRTHQLEERLRLGKKWDDHGLVFTGETGQPLYGPNVTRRFQRILSLICDECGRNEAGHADLQDHAFRSLPRMRFHDLRHSCASLLLAQGVPLSTIQEVLGHSSFAFTRDVYAHLSEELKRDAASAMDVALGTPRMSLGAP